MKKPKTVKIERVEDDEDDTLDVQLEDRKKDYTEFKYVQKQLGDLYPVIEQAFDDKLHQAETIDECWDIYNCVLTSHQQYNGKSQVYIPVVRDAINARKTRFINMLFPQSGRYAEVVRNDGEIPYEQMALLDHYVGVTNLRKRVIPAMLRGGDISGNYALYLEWGAKSRFIVSKEMKQQEVDGMPIDGAEEYEDVTYEEVKDERPVVSVLDTRNLVVLPATATCIEEAETVVVALRYTKDKIRELMADGTFEDEAGKTLLDNLSGNSGNARNVNTGKKSAQAAGVQLDSKGNKTALIYQAWTKLKIRGQYRWMVAHYGAADLYLGCKRNPYWNDRIPVLLQPVEPDADSVWGPSQVKPVKEIQYAATDAANMGFDSAQYSLLPIVMTDPEKNPQIGSMILSMASIWMTNPNDTKFVEFPALWKDAFTLIGSCKAQIYESLGVNAAMIPHSNPSKKPTQAEIAQQQQVALETTADEVSILEQMLAQLLEWFYDLDYQYRTKAITVEKFGQLGIHATMDQVPAASTRQRLTFKWYGVESFKATQQVQQMISWGNVLMKMPPQALNGRKVDLGPMLEYITEVTCGPRIAPYVLIDQRHQLSIDPMTENELMDNQFPVQTHAMDDDVKHIQAHMASMKAMPNEFKRGHILEHIKQLKAKAAEQQKLSGPPSLPPPGGPQAGAVPQPPTGGQAPPGAVRPDQMPLAPPRKM
jgi:hypothetical protein